MAVVYKAIFEEITSQRDEEQEATTKRDSSQITEKGTKIDSKLVGKAVTTGVALALAASQIYAKQQAKSNTITGNSIAQVHLNNSMAYLNEGLKLVGTLGVAALVNPTLLPAAALGLAVSYGFKAYDTNQQNQVKQAQWQIQSVVNQEKQTRLVKNIAENRL
jgi:hypothetical protein